MYKKILAGVLALSLVTSSAAIVPNGVFDKTTVTASADHFDAFDFYGFDYMEENVKTSDGFQYVDWYTDEDHSLLGAVIVGYNGASNDVVIPSKIGEHKVIGVYSLKVYGDDENDIRERIKSLTIPESVTGIGDLGLGDWDSPCRTLESVTINANIDEIKPGMFEACPKLKTVKLSDSITEIGNSAFADCTALESINIPKSVTKIGEEAFSRCYELKSDIIIPEGVTEIADSTFSGCSNITTLNIPASMENLNFSNAFGGCTGLTNITVASGNEKYYAEDNMLIEDDYGKTLLYVGKDATSVTVPNDVEYIGDSAFYKCEKLTKVTLSDDVHSIGDSAFSLSSLSEINLPKSVRSIGNRAFTDTNITNIEIPYGVSSLGVYTFDGCQKLTDITIPETVTEIDPYAFYDCSNFTIHGYKGSAAEEYANRFDDITFDSLGEATGFIIGEYLDNSGAYISQYIGKGGKVVIPSEFNGKKITGIEMCAFKDPTNVNNGNDTITEVVIPEGVTYMNTAPFEFATNLTSVTLPDSLENISTGAFNGCTKLKNITIPKNVKSIGMAAFTGTAVESITIPNGVEYIYSGTFANCADLKNITIPKSVTEIVGDAFENHNTALTISCYKNSAAHNFAKANNIKFKLLDGDSSSSSTDSSSSSTDSSSSNTDSSSSNTNSSSSNTDSSSSNTNSSSSNTDSSSSNTENSSSSTDSSSSNTDSSSSNTDSKPQPPVEAKLDAPTNVRVTTRRAKSIRISWDGVPEADGYTFYQKKNGIFKRISVVKKTSAGVTKLAAGKAGEYRVRAFKRNVNGKTVFSEPVSVKAYTNPDSVRSFKAVQRGKTLSLSWAKTAGADGYRVYLYKGGKFVKLKQTKKSSLKIAAPKKGSVKYAVKAFKRTSSDTLWGEKAETSVKVK